MNPNFAAFALVACVMLAWTGCVRPVPYDCAAVQGMVLIDGKPVPNGTITFSPQGAGQGPVTGAAIIEGAFLCNCVPIGTHTVTFHAEGEKPRTFTDGTGVVRTVPQDILPPQYRKGLPWEVKGGEPNQVEFLLTSKAQK